MFEHNPNTELYTTTRTTFSLRSHCLSVTLLGRTYELLLPWLLTEACGRSSGPNFQSREAKWGSAEVCTDAIGPQILCAAGNFMPDGAMLRGQRLSSEVSRL
jgi:hypothetical protein